MIEAGKKYDAKVVSADFTESSSKGTPGVHIRFDLFDGSGERLTSRYKTVWLTVANKDRFEKDMNTLGVPTEALATDEFYSDPGKFLVGAECSLAMENEDYNGNTTVEIKWINSRGRATKAASADKVALAKSIFASVSQEMGGYEAKGLRDDDDGVPF